MNIIAKLFPLILSLVFLSFAAVSAQDSVKVVTSNREKAKVITSRMERELSLSTDQTASILQIVFERFESLSKMPSGNAQKMPTANDAAMKKLSSVLTKQQLAILNQIKSQRTNEKAEFIKKNPTYQFSKEDIELDF